MYSIPKPHVLVTKNFKFSDPRLQQGAFLDMINRVRPAERVVPVAAFNSSV